MTTPRTGLGRRLIAAASCLGLIAGLSTGADAAGPPAGQTKASQPFTGGFAVVLPTGQIVHGRNVTGARLAETGVYEVDFAGSVAKCGLFATLSSPSSGTPLDGTIGTTTLPGNPRGILVLIHSGGSSASANTSFAVQAVC